MCLNDIYNLLNLYNGRIFSVQSKFTSIFYENIFIKFYTIDMYCERNNSLTILSHLDIFAGRLSAAFEFTSFQLQI